MVKTNNILSKNRKFLLIILDSLSTGVSFFLSFYLMFDFSFPEVYKILLVTWLPIIIFFQVVICSLFGFYQIIWRFTSLWEMLTIIKYLSITSILSFFAIAIITKFSMHPGSVLLTFYIFNILIICSTRVSVRVYFSHFRYQPILCEVKFTKKIILIGAGKTGVSIAREILNSSQAQYDIIGFIDDDPLKKNLKISGIEVLGNVSILQNLIIPFDELLITTPGASSEQIRTIITACRSTGKKFKTVPSLSELINKSASIDAIRDVSYLDLLGREEVKLDLNSIEHLFKGKRVLITGSGGSIGSELLKQCLAFSPSEVICIDFSEEKIFDIMEMAKTIKTETLIKAVLADINNKKEMEKVYIEHRPKIVLHAAAYKHVPIQEIHPWTAVRTNVSGTLCLLELSDKYNAEKFILVSTDKAVNPVNVMGATKRIAEVLTQSMNAISKTQFLAVRFGNVLGSSGSAIPIFEKQIKKGGPVTVTHPEMTRYFMSIQEASQLILQSAAIGNGGEIVLLEMGKPINIDRLARDLIKLKGYEPQVDIPIIYSGLRPGEKLYEELQSRDEILIPTEHKKIMILREDDRILDWNLLNQKVSDLITASKELDSDKIQTYLKELLPKYVSKTYMRFPEDVHYNGYKVKA